MNEERCLRMLAAAQGIDLLARLEEAPFDHDPSAEQASLEQIITERAEKNRDLENRAQELKNGTALLLSQQQELVRDREDFTQIQLAYEEEMREIEEGAVKTGRSRDVRTFKGLKSSQAKEFLVAMLDAEEIEDVVILMASIPDRERFKIIAEFDEPDELEQIGEVLKRIRYGEPEIIPAQKTLGQFKPADQ